LFKSIKNFTRIFFITLAVLSIAVRVFCYPADAQDISGPKYFPAIKQAIAKAQKSIKMVMFIIELPLEKRAKYRVKVQQLVDELVKAKERGVDVEAILDANVNFVNRRHKSEWQEKMCSIRTYRQLKKSRNERIL